MVYKTVFIFQAKWSNFNPLQMLSLPHISLAEATLSKHGHHTEQTKVVKLNIEVNKLNLKNMFLHVSNPFKTF